MSSKKIHHAFDFNFKKESGKIISGIKSVLKKTNHNNVIIAVSGGIDSAVSLNLLTKSLNQDNIYAVHLPFKNDTVKDYNAVLDRVNFPIKNRKIIPIKSIVDEIEKLQNLQKGQPNYKLRSGNIQSRTRMMLLFDLAKKHNALVCGTENKSEHLLGYFTRYGDQASDFEPIIHLYKTQIYSLAKFLDIPLSIQAKKPSAGLWEGQSDEREFGFTYKEADIVLHLYFDLKKPLVEIKKLGFPNVEEIISWVNKNSFKNKVPYLIR